MAGIDLLILAPVGSIVALMFGYLASRFEEKEGSNKMKEITLAVHTV